MLVRSLKLNINELNGHWNTFQCNAMQFQCNSCVLCKLIIPLEEYLPLYTDNQLPTLREETITWRNFDSVIWAINFLRCEIMRQLLHQILQKSICEKKSAKEKKFFWHSDLQVFVFKITCWDLITTTSLNVQNLKMLFNFSVLYKKYFFYGKFVPKNQNWGFRLKFSNYTNWKMMNLMLVFTFFVLGHKYSFSVNLTQMLKIS